MKRILIIAYSYPPLMEAQSIRWAHLSRELVRKGNEVDVLTIRLPSYYDDGLYLVRGVSVHRTYPGPIQNLFFNTKAALRVEDKSYQEKRGSIAHQFLRGSYETLRRFMNFVLIPGLRTEWLPFAMFKLIRILNKKQFDIVISSHEPGVDHLLGFVAKTFYPIQWIGDFSDPMLTFYTPKMRRPIDQRVQGALLKRMDRVLVTNRKLKEDFLTQYPFLSSNRICLLTQGFDDGLWKDAERVVHDKKRLRLVYTGTFYRNERDPLELFKALRDLKEMDVEFLIAGRNDEVVSDAKKFGLLGNKVNYLGYLKYRDSIRVQQEGDVLVHIGNRSSNQVPGKIYEYLGARKPILAILRNPNDEMKDLVLRLKRGVVIPDEAPRIREAVFFLWELHRQGKLPSSFNLSLEEVDQYSWKSLSNLLINGIGGDR